MEKWLEDWLLKTNGIMGDEEIPYVARPLEAMHRLSIEKNLRFLLPSQLATDISEWFEQNSPKGSLNIGSMFTGSLYFDGYFWSVEIPIGYGRFVLNSLDSLREMPEQTKGRLKSQRGALWSYAMLWVDTLDYAFGIDDVGRGKRMPQKGNVPFSSKLVASADRELRGCVRLLSESRRPNPKALESARMSMEMFLKAYLAVHTSLAEQDAAKKFGHDLKKLALACKAATPDNDMAQFEELASIFPVISARYDGNEYDNKTLWSGYAAALRTGVSFTRSLTDRDSREQLRVQPSQ